MKARFVMKAKKVLAALAAAVVLGVSSAASGAEVSATTGAGYKPMLESLAKEFRAAGGEIREAYGGHIGQMLMQIAQGSGVAVVVSDEETLKAANQGVEFGEVASLGDTVLVLAWRKGLSLEKPQDLEKDEFRSITMPDAKAAIYGRAAAAFLQSSGIGAKIEKKLSVVSSVPQVFAYLVSGEMDAGFLNRVMILKGGDKLGGWLEIADGYPPLNMVAAVVKGHEKDPEVVRFLDFLKGDAGKKILKQFGVW